MGERSFFGRWGIGGAVLLLLLLTACDGSAQADTSVARGQLLYEQYCAECHGIQGEGQPDWKVPDAAGAYPAPPHDGSGHTWHHADDLLLEIIAQGGSMSNSQMPGFAGQMTQEEMVWTLDYIKTFWGKNEQEFQAQMNRQFRDRDR